MIDFNRLSSWIMANLRKISVVVFSFLLLFVFFNAYINHRDVYNTTKETLINIDANVSNINKNISEIKDQHISKMIIADTIYNSKELDDLQRSMNESSCNISEHIDNLKMECVKTFDANTITFLISLIFVVLCSIFFDTIKKVNDVVRKAEEQWNTAEMKLANNFKFDVYLTRLACINSYSVLGKYILSINGYIITSEFISNCIYRMDRELLSLSRVLEQDISRGGLKLQQEDKNELIEMIDNIRNNINIDKLSKKNIGNGLLQVGLVVDNLNELESRIARIEPLTPTPK